MILIIREFANDNKESIMCGLVGVAKFSNTGLFQEQCNVFTDLLIADSVRGPDSTGLFYVTKKGRGSFLKQVGNPYNLIYTKQFYKAVSATEQPYRVLLAGHNRWATKGKVSIENAHPFMHRNIMLMHNGTLTEYDKLPKQFDVDSQALCYSIAEWGLDKTISHIKGAYALVYYDSQTQTLNFARNYERPLFLAINQAESELIWASEKEMIDWVISRHKITGVWEINQITPNTLYSTPINKLNLIQKPMPITGQDLVPQYTTTNWKMSKYWENDPLEAEYEKKIVAPIKSLPKEPTSEMPAKNGILIAIKSKATEKYMAKEYKRGDHIRFIPYDKINLISSDIRKIVIGKREDMDASVLFKLMVPNEKKADQLLEEKELLVKISNLALIEGKIIVWCSDVDKKSTAMQLH